MRFIAVVMFFSTLAFAQDPRQFPTHRTQVTAFVDLLMTVQMSEGMPVADSTWAMVVKLISEDFLTKEVWKDLYLRHDAYLKFGSGPETEAAAWYEERLLLLQRFSLNPTELLAFIPGDRDSAEVQKSFRFLMNKNFRRLDPAKQQTIFSHYYSPRHLLNFSASDFVTILLSLTGSEFTHAQAWAKVTSEMRELWRVNPEQFASYVNELSEHTELASARFVDLMGELYRVSPSEAKDASVQAVRKFIVMRAIYESEMVPVALEILFDTRVDLNSKFELANNLFAERQYPDIVFNRLVDIAVRIARAPAVPSVRTPAYDFLFTHFHLLSQSYRQSVQMILASQVRHRGEDSGVAVLAKTLIVKKDEAIVGFNTNLWNLITNPTLKRAIRQEIVKDQASELLLRLFVPRDWELYATNAVKACYFAFRGRR